MFSDKRALQFAPGQKLNHVTSCKIASCDIKLKFFSWEIYVLSAYRDFIPFGECALINMRVEKIHCKNKFCVEKEVST